MIVRSVTDQVEAWLADQLRDGPRERASLVAECPWSATSLLRAARNLGVVSRARRTWPRTTVWELPLLPEVGDWDALSEALDIRDD